MYCRIISLQTTSIEFYYRVHTLGLMNFDITIIFIKTSRFLIVSDYKHTIVYTQVYYTFYSSFSISCIYKKFAILKKGIGIESQNLCKKFNNQKTIQTRWNSTVAIEQKVDSKAFAIPILTASASII